MKVVNYVALLFFVEREGKFKEVFYAEIFKLSCKTYEERMLGKGYKGLLRSSTK
jgi:hypothetical protein